jgi:hypothetical protein
MSILAPLRQELTRILDAVTILSPSSFTFCGQAASGLAPPLVGLQLHSSAPPLMNELTGQLYQHCFANRFTGQIVKSDTPRPDSDGAWSERLARANQSRDRWEDGWQVLQSMPNGQLIARRGAITRMLSPGEFVNLNGSGMFLAPGSSVRVYVPRESRTVQPGYYFAFGETLPDSCDEFSMVRFYWNVSAEGAADLLQLVSMELNLWQVPFRFKTGVQPEMLRRCDSAVLYTLRRCASFTCELVLEIRKRIEGRLRAEAPLFTLRLAPGLAFAEDPGTQESFGMSRCRMLAQGIWLAHEQEARSTEERLAIVEQHLRSEGISLARPWLNPGSADDLAFPAEEGEAA